MPEISDNASIFIATSWQALDRANRYKDDAGLRFCNSMIILIFACFYLEETLNVIKDQPENKKIYGFFFKNNDRPGMFAKMCWFYNTYLLGNQFEHYSSFPGETTNKFEKRMELITSEFHNFDQLHSFRNNLSHPDDYEDIVNNFELVKELRESSKVIVSKMLKIAKLTDLQNIEYKTAVKKLAREYKEGS